MSNHVVQLADVTISSGQTASSAVAAGTGYKRAKYLVIGAPATLPEVITVTISLDDGVTYHTLQSGGSDIVIGAGKAVVILAQGWTHMKINAGGAVGGDRTFKVNAVESI